MPYGLTRRKTGLMRSSVVKWRQSQQEMYLEKSKRKDVNKNPEI